MDTKAPIRRLKISNLLTNMNLIKHANYKDTHEFILYIKIEPYCVLS